MALPSSGVIADVHPTAIRRAMKYFFLVRAAIELFAESWRLKKDGASERSEILSQDNTVMLFEMKARIIEIEPYFKGLYNINFGDIYPVVRTSISGEHKNKKAHLIKTKKGDYLTMYDHQVELLK